MDVHVTVALDNITLRGVNVDSNVLLAVGEVQNSFLERNRKVMADHFARLTIFGNSAYIINENGDMELVD